MNTCNVVTEVIEFVGRCIQTFRCSVVVYLRFVDSITFATKIWIVTQHRAVSLQQGIIYLSHTPNTFRHPNTVSHRRCLWFSHVH